MHQDMLLAQMKTRYRCGIVVHIETVVFVYDDGDGGILVADFVEVPKELDGCITPGGMVGGGSLRDIEEEPVSVIAASVWLLAKLRHTCKDTAFEAYRPPFRSRRSHSLQYRSLLESTRSTECDELMAQR